MTKTPKEKEKGKKKINKKKKTGDKLPSRRSNYPLGEKETRLKMDTEQGEQPKGARRSESEAEDTVNTHEAEVLEENKASEGCHEQERQR